MAKLSISITTAGQEALKRSFYKVVEAVDDFRPHWKEVKSELFEIEREIFASEGGKSASGRWQELPSPYKEIKAANYGDHGILYREGDFYRSLTSDTPDTIFNTDKNTLEFGSSLPYFRAHQLGKGVPRRAPVDFTSEHKTRIGRRMRKSLMPFIRKSGLKVIE